MKFLVASSIQRVENIQLKLLLISYLNEPQQLDRTKSKDIVNNNIQDIFRKNKNNQVITKLKVITKESI